MRKPFKIYYDTAVANSLSFISSTNRVFSTGSTGTSSSLLPINKTVIPWILYNPSFYYTMLNFETVKYLHLSRRNFPNHHPSKWHLSAWLSVAPAALPSRRTVALWTTSEAPRCWLRYRGSSACPISLWLRKVFVRICGFSPHTTIREGV